MSINSLTNGAVARRFDFEPFGDVPHGLSEIAAAAVGMPAARVLPASAPGAVVPPPAVAPAAAPPGAGGGVATASNGVTTTLNVLAGYIPTEVLTVYVAVVAALHADVAGAVTATTSLTSSWAAFFSFLVATPLVLWLVYASKLKSAQKPLPLAVSSWPIWEMFAATLAYSAWAFALPGSPFHACNWYSAAISSVVVLVTSTVLGLLAPLFQNRLQ